MSRLQTVLGLLVVCVCVSAAWARGPEGAERLALANGLFARGIYDLAAEEYEAILREEPELDAADTLHFRLGECYRSLGRTQDAEKQFGLVFRNYPESEHRLRAGYRRAGLFFDLGMHGAAVDLYDAVLELKPDADIAAAATYLKAEALLRLDRETEAIKTLQIVEERYPESAFHPYALLKLGQIYAGYAERPTLAAKALALFKRVAAEPPDPRLGAEAQFQLAEWHYRAEAFDKSAEAFEALAARYPDDPRTRESRLRRAWAAYRAGLHADALTLAAAVLDAGKDPPPSLDEWLYLKANCERRLMRHPAAVASYQALLRHYPDSAFADPGRYELALALYKAGRYREAVEAGRTLTPDSALQADVYWLLGESYAALKSVDQAIQYYRLLVDRFPDNAMACDARYRIGYHLQERGDFVAAARAFEPIAAACPESELAPRARFASGYCLARAGEDAKAVRDWTALIQDFPRHALAEETMFQRAMSEIRLERNADALRSLSELLRRFPKSSHGPDALYWQGRLLHGAERYADAEGSLRRALAGSPSPELQREATLALALVLQALDKHADAADAFQSLLDTPARAQLTDALLEWLAGFRLDQGQHGKAEPPARLLTEAERPPAARQAGWVLLGRVAEQRDDTAAAARAYESALAIAADSPGVTDAALALGNLALAAGDGARAAPFFERVAASPRSADAPGLRARAYAGLGRAARLNGELEAAARYLMSVAILYDDEALVPASLTEAADIFETMGNTNAAAAARQELLGRYPRYKKGNQP